MFQMKVRDGTQQWVLDPSWSQFMIMIKNEINNNFYDPHSNIMIMNYYM